MAEVGVESAPSLNRVNFVSEVKIPILRVSKYILVMKGRFTDDYMAYR